MGKTGDNLAWKHGSVQRRCSSSPRNTLTTTTVQLTYEHDTILINTIHNVCPKTCVTLTEQWARVANLENESHFRKSEFAQLVSSFSTTLDLAPDVNDEEKRMEERVVQGGRFVKHLQNYIFLQPTPPHPNSSFTNNYK